MRMLERSIYLGALMGMSVAAGCSDVECLDSEIKSGKVCFPKTKRSDASAATAEEDDDAGLVRDDGGPLVGMDAAQGDGSASLSGGDSGSVPGANANDASADGVKPADGGAVGGDAQQTAPEEDAQAPAPPSDAGPPPKCGGATPNMCGGCGKLAHEPGAECSNGGMGPCDRPGVYACDGEDATKCNAPPPMPGTEKCDGIDNDCDGMTDEGLLNACGACGAVPVEVCDMADNDCDGMTDESLLNACGTCGEVPAEVCDGADNDCDGQVDESVDDAPLWYADCDGDGYPTDRSPVKGCASPPATAECKAHIQTAPVRFVSLDCDDTSTAYNPGKTVGAYNFTQGLGPAGPLRYDVNCDGVVKLTNTFVNSSRILPACVNSGTVCANPEDCVVGGGILTTEYCGSYINTRTASRLSGNCQEITTGVYVLCI